MCEIAVIDPEQAPIQAAHQICGTFHEEQGDGLGVLAVKNHGDHFTYDTYKSTDPHWQTLYSFFKRNYDEAWRFVIHGRAQTSGRVARDTSHPIEVDCQHCDVDYVVHNGSIRNHRNIRAGMSSQGHSFNTKVDTEIIGHKVGAIPDDISDHSRSTYTMSGNLNYLVFSADGILVRVSQKYHLTDDFTMTCSLNKFEDYEELGFERGNDNEWMLVTPNGAEPEVETKNRTVYTAGRSTSSTGSSSSSRTRSATTGAQRSSVERWNDWQNRVSDDDGEYGPETFTVEYKDHAEFDHITAIKVAPGVMRIIDTDRDEEEYIWRDEDPRLYFYYAPDPTPDNIDQLEQLAEASRQREAQQATLESFPQEEVGAAVAEEVSSTIARNVDGVDISDLAEVREDLVDDAVVATQSAVEQYGD